MGARLNITYLRFRLLDVAHAIIGPLSGNLELWETACGSEFNRHTGEQDAEAKKCPACQKAILKP